MAKSLTQLPHLYERLEALETKIANTKLLIAKGLLLPRGAKAEIAKRLNKTPAYVQTIYLGRYTPKKRMFNRVIKVTNEVLEEYKNRK